MHFTHNIYNRGFIRKHRHSEGKADIESHSYSIMYDTGTNPTTTYIGVGDCVESSMSARFSSSGSKSKRRFYNTRYLRFGWTRRPPRESQQHKHKYFRRNKGHSLIGNDGNPQSADNPHAKIVRKRPKGFKRPSPGAHNPLTEESPVKKTADKTGKTTAAAKAKSLPRFLPTRVVQREVTAKTSATMKVFRTSENTTDTQQPLLSSQDKIPSSNSDQINSSENQGTPYHSKNDQNFYDTSF